MSTEVREDTEQQRFEILVDGEVAGFAEYRLAAGMRIFPHTEIEERFGGRGLGGELIGAAMRATRAAGEDVVPLCPFVQHYLRTHPEDLDLVRDVHRRAFGLGTATDEDAAA